MRAVGLTGVTILVTVMACSAAGSTPGDQKRPEAPGESLYKSQCAMCHGRKGNLNISGAKDLTKSALSEEEMIAVVTHGRGGMIGFDKTLSPQQIREVVAHVRTLRATE